MRTPRPTEFEFLTELGAKYAAYLLILRGYSVRRHGEVIFTNATYQTLCHLEQLVINRSGIN